LIGEILFRGKTLDDMWLLGCGCFVDQTGRAMLAKIMPVNGIAINRPMIFEVEPETLGQYTGLKDKNGIRVFGGDILAYNNLFSEVVYDSRHAMFIVKNGDVFWLLGDTIADGHVVVGNIWDNPDLVKHVKE
jgi:hypothetical protein